MPTERKSWYALAELDSLSAADFCLWLPRLGTEGLGRRNSHRSRGSEAAWKTRRALEVVAD